jgi:hypothetical protein
MIITVAGDSHGVKWGDSPDLKQYSDPEALAWEKETINQINQFSHQREK